MTLIRILKIVRFSRIDLICMLVKLLTFYALPQVFKFINIDNFKIYLLNIHVKEHSV